MSCDDLHDVVSAYVDGEASLDDQARVEQHLRSCHACRQRVESLRRLKHAVATLPARTRPPEAVFARVEALQFRRYPGRRPLLRSPLWLAVSGVLVVLGFVVAGLWFDAAQPSLTDELVFDHVKYVPVAMPAEVASKEPAVVRQFFEGKVPFEPVVPLLDGAELIGGRLCRIRGYYEQLLFYEKAGRKLSLYVSNRPETPSQCEVHGDYAVCGQRRGATSLMLVSDLPQGELRSLLHNARL